MNVVIRDFNVASGKIKSGTTDSIRRRRTRCIGDLKASDLHVAGLDVEPLHYHRTLRLEGQESARPAGCDDLNALVVSTRINDDCIAAVQRVRGLLNRSPR